MDYGPLPGQQGNIAGMRSSAEEAHPQPSGDCQSDRGRASAVGMSLPVLSERRPERADAARNRSAILDAASALLDQQGVELITMDAVACAAGVGKGTLFRRFGDRASLFHALLDERERRLQEGFIRGPAPLGPGACACARIVAFGHALLDMVEEQGDLLVAAAAGSPGMHYRSPVYGAYRAHLSGLLTERFHSDAEYLSDVLLAGLAPQLVLHQRRVAGVGLAQLKDGWERLVRALLD